MQVHVTLYGALRVVAGKQVIDVSFSEPTITIAQLLDALAAKYPRIRPYLLNTTKEALHSDIRILLNGFPPPSNVTLNTRLQDNDRITLFIPVTNPF
jgi:molybdopterin converting factor small subunit